MLTATDELTHVLQDLVADPVTKFTPSVYETAQYLRVGDREKVRDRQIGYLLDEQHVDGSWGEPGHEIIPTLAAVACLHELGDPGGRGAEVDAALRNGARYLWTPVLEGRLLPDLPNTVAAEIIAPSLIELTRPILRDLRPGPGAAGSPQDLPGIGGSNDELYRRFRAVVDRGEALPRKIWHSLEIFAPLDRDVADVVSAADGAVACSPAATVAWLAALDGRDPGPDTGRYLEEIESRYDGAIPMGSSMPFFEFLWVCNFALKCPSPPRIPQALIDLFERSLTESGIGGGPGLPPDGDDTAYALMLMENASGRSDPTLLERFWEGDRFRTYTAEQTPSETTNAHALEYLSLIERVHGTDRYAGTKRDCAAWLCSVQDDAGFWLDKWHISPYYSTGECLSALLASGLRTPEVERAVGRAVDWLFDSQSDDGGWGIRGRSTREESSYAAIALHRYGSAADGGVGVPEAIGRAEERIATAGDETPPMWMGKDLYRPERVVRSVEAAGLGVVAVYRESRS